MPDFDVRAAVEVGDGAGHLQDAVVGRTLFADVGREVYFDSTIYLPVISVYFLILLSKLSILSVDKTLKPFQGNKISMHQNKMYLCS